MGQRKIQILTEGFHRYYKFEDHCPMKRKTADDFASKIYPTSYNAITQPSTVHLTLDGIELANIISFLVLEGDFL
jgi:hypothetical protein